VHTKQKMASKSSRLKGALRRVFKVRDKRRNRTKHVALDASQGNSRHTLPVIPEDATIDSRGPGDLDELMCSSDSYKSELSSVLSCKTETSFISGASDEAQFCADDYRQEPTRSDCSSKRSVHETLSAELSRLQNELQTKHISSTTLALTPRTMKRSISTPYEHQDIEVRTTQSLEERFGPGTPKGRATPNRYSPVSVFDFLLPLQGKGLPPSMGRKGSDLGLRRDQDGNKPRPRLDSNGSRKYDNQKSNEAFLALKKELEKNEFTKATQVIKQAKSCEGSILTTALSQESVVKARIQDEDNFEIIPLSPTSESAPSVSTEILNNTLGIVPVSRSTSGDSQEGSVSSHSTFDMESIGEITVDSTTQRLIDMHKIYCEYAKVNENHPARMKKSNMRVSSAYAAISSESDLSIKTEANRKLTWYDDEENLDRSFTLRTDESFFLDTMSFESTPGLEREIRRSLEYMDNFLIPFAKQGLEKVFGRMNCGGNGNSLEFS
jgi:hypothetical protein